jgi:hypothetical protein
MGDIILDLGSEVNVLPEKTWQCMGDPTLGYSLVQLKLANQHRVIPIGRLKGAIVDIIIIQQYNQDSSLGILHLILLLKNVISFSLAQFVKIYFT